jgi:hypothetical protein
MHADVDVVPVELDSIARRRNPHRRHVGRRNIAKFLHHRPRQPHGRSIRQLDLDRVAVRVIPYACRPPLHRPPATACRDSIPEFILGGRRNLHGAHCSTPAPAFMTGLVPSFMISVTCPAGGS